MNKTEGDPRKNITWSNMTRDERLEALLEAILDNQLSEDRQEWTPEQADMAVGG